MLANSDFNFKNNYSRKLELPLSEHIEEFRQRFFHIFWIILFLTSIAFFEVKFLVQLLELPVSNVKFFQLSPSEYFVSTLKISFYTGLLFGSPFAIGQIVLFLLPGLTTKEKKSHTTFNSKFFNFIWFRIVFFLLFLNPYCFKLFLNYSDEVIEPLWSFDQYFEFILVLFYTTGLIFQIPILQILLGLSNIISVEQMSDAWRYVTLSATLIAGILTPSTDPLTQMALSFAILFLYFSGIILLFLIKNKFILHN